MIKIVILYIFALYILLIPGVLIKKNYSLPEKILYSVLFAVILYFTYDLVDQKREFMNVNINSTGVDNIKKISDSMKSTTGLSVDYDNTVQETEITENVGDAGDGGPTPPLSPPPSRNGASPAWRPPPLRAHAALCHPCPSSCLRVRSRSTRPTALSSPPSSWATRW